jgi:hypothetical protein
MHHLLAFNNPTLAISAVYAQVPGVADGSMPRNQAGDYLMPFAGKVIGHHVIGLTTNQAQIQAPSMRTIAYPELWPPNITARTGVPDINRYQVPLDSGPRFVQNESIGVYASNSSGAAVSPTSAALWITDGIEPASPGQTITLVATSTIITVDGSWVLGTLAFSTQLAAGTYRVVGMDVVGANCLYARLVFPGNTGMRPGVPCAQLETRVNWRDTFRFGRFGVYGNFVFNAPPQLEVFGNAAASTPFRVLLDVQKIG